jgi:hypothetical protein
LAHKQEAKKAKKAKKQKKKKKKKGNARVWAKVLFKSSSNRDVVPVTIGHMKR